MAAASPAAHTGCVGDGVHLGLYRPPTQPHAREMAATHLEALRPSGAAAARFRGRPAGVGLGSRLKVGGRLWGSCLAPAQHPRTRAQLRAAARKGV